MKNWEFKDWEFNKMEISNYNDPHTKLFKYFEFIKNNYNRLEGDIFEFGVYKGRSLFATALLLKLLKSDKKVYGFDTYYGLKTFVNAEDNITNFYDMYKNNKITLDHINDIEKLKQYNNFLSKNNDILNISTSNDFSDTSLEYLNKKKNFLELDNIIFVEGPFEETIEKYKQHPIFCSNIDCDLYSSYKCCLPVVYKNLVKTGFIHLDEYYSLKFPGAKLFCDEFCKKHNIKLQKHLDKINNWERWYIIK